MALNSDKSVLTRQYLLGALSPADVAYLEENYFVDNEFFQEVEIAEDELVDAYVRGELSEEETRQFKSNLARLPRLAERIKFAQVLERATRIPSQSNDATGVDAAAPITETPKDDSAEPQNIFSVSHAKETSSGWKNLLGTWLTPQRIGALTTAIVLLTAGGFLFRDWLRLRQETRQLVAEREETQRQNELLTTKAEAERRELAQEITNAEAQNESLRKELERALAQVGSVLPRIDFPLFPGGSRDPSGRSSDLPLPAKPSTIVAWLALETTDYPKYEAIVKRVGGREVAHQKDLQPTNYKSTPSLKLPISSSLLRRGDYTVTVNGLPSSSEPVFVTSYRFRIIDRAD